MTDRAKYLRGFEIHRVVLVDDGTIVVVYRRPDPTPPPRVIVETTGDVVDLASRRAA